VDHETNAAAAYYMINCAHPDHFAHVLDGDDPALGRVRGVRANASRLSHSELDESIELDDGDPDEFGARIATLHRDRPEISVLGGCCGTDARHVAAIAASCRTA
jgi:homocysteine S-methyltransferase